MIPTDSVMDIGTRKDPHPACFHLDVEAPKPDENDATVHILRTVQELEQVREVWSSWCDDPSSDIDLFLAVLKCRPDFIRPHVIVVQRAGVPDCMLVGRLERRRLKLKVGYLALLMPEVNQLFFLQGGTLGNFSPENSQLVALSLKRSLASGESDSVELTRVAKGRDLDLAIQSEFGFLRRGHFMPVHEHRWLELPQTFGDFVRALSRKNRHELRRHERKLVEDFRDRLHVRCYRHEVEVGELMREAEKIAAGTYQRSLGVGFEENAEVLESLCTSARKGTLRGCVLYLDEHPCAFFIGKHCKTTFYGNYMGFNPQFAEYSPGLYILMHSLEECFDPRQRATKVDFGWGDRHYKRMLCNRSAQDGPIYLYRLSLRGIELNLLRSAISLLDLSARKLVANSLVLQRLKKALQGGRVATRRTAKASPEGVQSTSEYTVGND